jgi:Tol biopolymer transport system component
MVQMNRILIICIALVFSSCLKFPTSSPTEPDLSEDRGILLTSEIPTNWSTLLWSRNTEEIIVAGEFGIKAINIASRAIRSIEGANAVFLIKISHDGNKLYYLLGHTLAGGAEPLYKIFLDGKGRQLLLDNLCVAPFSLSSDSLIAHSGSSGGSIYLYNEGSKSNTFLSIGNPITFSPDGKFLLYSADSSLYTISIENRAVQRIPFPDDIFCINMIRWDENGIRIFYRAYDLWGYYVKNITTNETYKLWQLSGSDTPENLHFAWSPDGGKVAFWTSKCIKYKGLFNCEVSQCTLHVININERKEIRIAYANVSYEASIAFSPDSKKIAYVLGSQIYTKDIQ